ncbi:alpha/beta hydrolase [Cellulomonas massiliensis]|uniref:alpha/beta hydrolase n=1 Tax=Cellulomonas massiliensis TaxID=1465811 RepID=UPI0002FD252A|nr:alpha/beta hydrolase [Cellulomonas massiliensis]
MTVTASRRPPFDPEVEAALDARTDVVVGMVLDDVPVLRARAEVPAPEVLSLGGSLEVTTRRVPGAPGAPDVELLLLRPVGARGALPVIYHVHGGGLVAGTMYDDVVAAAELGAPFGCAVVSVGYRLAPEHPYPAALDDVYAGLRWLVRNAAEIGVDASRVVIEGVSAGGGLAAATALLARERGEPALAGQMLICPMLDDRNDSYSSWQMAGVGSWDHHANAVAWGAYLPGSAGSWDVPALAAAGRAVDLAGLPPAFVDVGSAETFRDEAVEYAQKIWRAGGRAELHVWPGGCHGFDFLQPDATLSRDARAARTRWLARLLGRDG